MTHQRPHRRRSKLGTTFKAGRGHSLVDGKVTYEIFTVGYGRDFAQNPQFGIGTVVWWKYRKDAETAASRIRSQGTQARVEARNVPIGVWMKARGSLSGLSSSEKKQVDADLHTVRTMGGARGTWRQSRL